MTKTKAHYNYSGTGRLGFYDATGFETLFTTQKLTDLDVGHIVVYFEERAGINPKKLHDETSEAAA